MEVYLDNSATTRPYDEVAKAVYDTMLSCYANPSSLHRLGKNAEDVLKASREQIAYYTGCKAQNIYFTSGGTESDSLAILGYAYKNKRSGNKLITGVTEHAAVLEPFRKLEQSGFQVVYIGVDADGMPDMDRLRREIDENTILVSFMYVNNENGAIFPIDEIASLCKNSKAAFHTDAVQAYGKLKINADAQNIDLMSISSHKIHGPGGVGALYVRDGIKLDPIVYGGKQESGLRSGTENVAGISGFATACKIKHENIDKDTKHTAYLKERLASGLLSSMDVHINTPSKSVCSILNVSFEGIKSEVLLHVLESKGIYVSTGSACNSKKNRLSYVLKEMGLKPSLIDGAVRFSFSPFNTKDEIDYVLEVLRKEVPILLKIMR